MRQHSSYWTRALRLLFQNFQNLRHADARREHLDEITAAQSDPCRNPNKFGDCPFDARPIQHGGVLVLLIQYITLGHGLLGTATGHGNEGVFLP